MPHLQLSPEQADALAAVKRERDTAAVGRALASALPALAGRAGAPQGARLAHGVRRAAALGLDGAACAARYLACCCVLGDAFEDRAEHAWARALLADSSRSAAERVFQLCGATRALLPLRHAGDGPVAEGLDIGPAAFDRALAALDAALLPLGVLGSLLAPVPPPLQLGQPCDIDTLELRPAEPEDAPRLYRPDAAGAWQHRPAGTPRRALSLVAGQAAAPGAPPAALPPRLFLLARPGAPGCARLRLRLHAGHGCAAGPHPLVECNDGQAVGRWHGAQAADLLLTLPAAAPAAASAAPSALVIARETAPRVAGLAVHCCGLRAQGRPLGPQRTQLAVYPGEQHRMAWRRGPATALAGPPGTAAAPPPACDLERDGQPLDAARWTEGLRQLDRQMADGLARLADAWARHGGLEQARMHCEPQLLHGSAALTWGWAAQGDGMAEAPCWRVAGMLDLVACQLRLRLAGELALDGARSLLLLQCDGRAELRCGFERQDRGQELAAVLQPARTDFRLPFELRTQALLQAGSACLLQAAGPVAAAVTGSCGLRPRPGGAGWQWFWSLGVEAVAAPLELHDPLLGGTAMRHPLLPALTLVDWSLG